MTFNWTAIGVAITIITLLLKVWDSIQRGGKERELANQQRFEQTLEKMDSMHAENKRSLHALTEEKDEEHKTIHTRLDKHREDINGIKGEVAQHGYRLTSLEKRER